MQLLNSKITKKKEYHLILVQRENYFLINFEGEGSNSVDVLIDKRKQQVIESNRKRIIPIIKSTLFYERNNLAMRGHRESGLCHRIQYEVIV